MQWQMRGGHIAQLRGAAVGREAIAKLAREDYDQQERYAAALVTRMQFALAIAGVLGTASAAMLKTDKLQTLPLFATVAFLACFLTVWIALLSTGVCIVNAIRVRGYDVPKAMDTYRAWMESRVKELTTKYKYTNAQAEWFAEQEVHSFIFQHYATAAGTNRSANLGRQHWVSRSSFWVIVAAGALVLQALLYCVITISEVASGRTA